MHKNPKTTIPIWIINGNHDPKVINNVTENTMGSLELLHNTNLVNLITDCDKVD